MQCARHGYFYTQIHPYNVLVMDIFILKALVDDLQQHLTGAVVSKVFQMSADDLLLRLWRQQEQRLLLSTQVKAARLHLTSLRFENPPSPPRFAAYLRSQLQRARIRHIAVQPYDRIVHLTWERQDDAPVTLIHELLGAQSNLLLVDAEGTILELLKRVAPDDGHRRTLLPGYPYQAPPQPAHRRSLSTLTLSDLLALARDNAFDAPHLQQLVIGLDPVVTTELILRSQGDPEVCWTELQTLRRHYDQGTLSIYLCTLMDGTRHVSVLPLTQTASHVEPYEDLQDALAAVYDPHMHTAWLQSAQQQALKQIDQQRRRLRKKSQNIQRDHEKLQSYLNCQRYGTLLMGHNAPRGASHIDVVDYYHPEQPTLTIPLDPKQSTKENAQAYFKKYRKAKGGLAKVQSLLDQCETDAYDLERLAQQVERAETWADVQAIAAQQPGLQSDTQRRARPLARPKTPLAQPYRTFIIHDGATLYCGKNHRGNDALLRHVAHPQDLWFHAHGHAGAHVLLKVQPQQPVPQQTLVEAASIAAYYSKAKTSAAVEVIYTQARNVRKFRGARPGQVQVTTYQTLEVSPQPPPA
jgi:predicted ribosome quality control (RQC) complex YloA/Tae2 family protein